MPIRGVPLLGIWLQLLESHGISDVLINLHHRSAQVVAFLAGWRTPIRVTTAYEPRLLGSAGTVAEHRRFVQGEEAFLIAYADNLTTANLGALVRFHGGRTEALTLGVVPTDRPREKGTVLLDPGGQVLAFEEKAANPRSHLANAGLYVSGPRLFDYLPEAAPADRALDFGHDVLPTMVPDLAACAVEGFLMDIGTPDAYADAQEIWPGLPG